MKTTLPRIALWLALALVLWFAAAVFGPKFGLIEWPFALGTMVRQLGPIFIGIVALVALVALIVALIGKPKGSWGRALFALAIPAAFMAGLASVSATAESVPPIHDVTTDPADPPMHSAAIMAERERIDANPVRGFDTPLGEYEEWKGSDVAGKTSAQLIAESFPDVRPLNTTADPAAALEAVIAGMEAIGLSGVTSDAGAGTAQGVAETFLFGFKDDVAARVRPGEDGGSVIDFRSTSRVGLSDLGYNADRIVKLRAAVAGQLP